MLLSGAWDLEGGVSSSDPSSGEGTWRPTLSMKFPPVLLESHLVITDRPVCPHIIESVSCGEATHFVRLQKQECSWHT
jgi:hypothetical protein